MGQRLIHPLTGQYIEPVYISKAGRVFWPILGAAEGDGDDDKKDKDDASGEGSGSDKGDAGDKGSEGSGDKSTEGDDKVSKEDLDAVTARMKAADQRASAAEKKVKEYEDKDKSELDKATTEVEELKKANVGLTETVQSLRLENSFALNTSFMWEDPALVFDIVQKREDVTIDDDGKVAGMDNALKAIAKDRPYLLKKDGEGNPLPRTGSKVGSGKPDQDTKDEAALRKKYRV